MKAWWTAPVKADTALLEIALDSGLWRLPEGASYAASSGRAHVKASVKQNTGGKPPTLVIESGCDSLARLCAYYEAENERLSVKNAHLQDCVQTVGGLVCIYCRRNSLHGNNNFNNEDL